MRMVILLIHNSNINYNNTKLLLILLNLRPNRKSTHVLTQYP